MNLFRELTHEEIVAFQQWARDNHRPGMPVSDLWHPVVREECAIIDAEDRVARGDLLPSQREALDGMRELYVMIAACEAGGRPKSAQHYRRRLMQLHSKMVDMHGPTVNAAISREAMRRAKAEGPGAE